jgi:predicted DNA-binding transcriptional regulator AlpA
MNALLTFDEVSARLGGVSRMTLARWQRKGGFPTAISLSQQIRWRECDIEEWLLERTKDRQNGNKHTG